MNNVLTQLSQKNLSPSCSIIISLPFPSEKQGRLEVLVDVKSDMVLWHNGLLLRLSLQPSNSPIPSVWYPMCLNQTVQVPWPVFAVEPSPFSMLGFQLNPQLRGSPWV